MFKTNKPKSNWPCVSVSCKSIISLWHSVLFVDWLTVIVSELQLFLVVGCLVNVLLFVCFHVSFHLVDHLLAMFVSLSIHRQGASESLQLFAVDSVALVTAVFLDEGVNDARVLVQAAIWGSSALV